MAVFLLIRHGNTDWVGEKLAGRLPEIPLNREGRLQAAQLADYLTSQPIALICSSPLERTRETAAPLAAKLGMEPRLCEGLTEIDYGEWTGCTFQELESSPLWHTYNTQRSIIRIPGGELMVEVQARMIAELLTIQQEMPQSMVAIFSHGDPIRTALAHFAGIDLDNFRRLTINPGSVSIVVLDDRGPRILGLNLAGAVRPMQVIAAG
jgi:probable phosphomutase (TIGR03848 family)